MAELTVLLENKKELVDHLNDILIEPLLQEVQSIYDDTRASLSIRESSSALLKKFQDKLTNIPEWSKEVKHSLYENIVEKSGITYIGELVQGILGTQIKIIIKTENPTLDVPKMKFRVPSAENFIHMCLITIARTIWKQTYLMYHNVRNLEKQHNIAQLEEIIRKSISTTIRSCLPLEELFKYIQANTPINNEEEEINDSDEEEEDEEETESDEEETESDEELEIAEEENEETEAEEDEELEIAEEEETESDVEIDANKEESVTDDSEDNEENIVEKIDDVKNEVIDLIQKEEVKVNEIKVEEINNDIIELSIDTQIEQPQGYDRDVEDNLQNFEAEVGSGSSSDESIEIIKNNEISQVITNDNKYSSTDVNIADVEPLQTIADLEKELEKELETIESSQTSYNEIIEEKPLTINEPRSHIKPKKLPLRIIPLNIRNEITRQSKLKDSKSSIPKKNDAFF
jgi:hypothetical protein